MNKGKIHITRLGESERDRATYFGAVNAIEEALGAQYPGLYEELRNVPRTIAGLTEEGVVAGGLIWDKKTQQDYLTVRFVGVSPKFQMKGVGARLLRSLDEIAQLMKVEGIEAMASGGAINWYLANGYKIGKKSGSMTTMLRTL